jgi:hypothetical protein
MDRHECGCCNGRFVDREQEDGMLADRFSRLVVLRSHWLATGPHARTQEGISEQQVHEAWQRSSARCQCREAGHWHGSRRCDRPLQQSMRGLDGWGGWAVRVWGDGTGDPRVEIICWACHVFSGTESGAGV